MVEQPGNQPENLKVGSASPATAAEISHQTAEGVEVRVSGITDDPESPENLLATRHTFNLETGEATAEHGKIKRTHIREAANYVWEHKKGASAIMSVTVSVALGSLWVRHKKR